MEIQEVVLFYCFICHCGTDTKKNIAGLIYWILSDLGFRPFLDAKSLNLGERFPRKIKEAIHGCTIGIVLFSPGFCNSRYCLDELLLLLEMKKAILPIFWNILPSGLVKVLENNNQRFSESDMPRYRTAIEEAKSIMGLTFQSEEGDWAKLMKDIVDAVYNIYYKRQKDSPMHHMIKMMKDIVDAVCNIYYKREKDLP